MIKFQSRHKVNVTLESIAFVDVVMNLFVFFFVTFSLLATFQQKEARLKIDLPSGKHAEAAKKDTDQSIVVSIMTQGEILVNEQPVSLESLSTLLKNLVEKNDQKMIELYADRSLKLQNFVEVLDVVQTVGAKRVLIRTEVPKSN